MDAESLNSEKQRAQHLLSQLAPEQVAAVVHVMQVMPDPFARMLANAPFEDEEIGPAEQAAVAEAREWLKQNEGIPHKDVLADFGLSPEDFERMGSRPPGGSPSRH
jgi:hypothetical protein